MRLKLTVVLFIANLLVFGLIIYRDAASSGSSDNTTRGIVGPEVQDAVGLTLAARGEDGLIQSRRSFSLDGDQWVLTEPLDWPARRDAVERILAQLQFVQPEIQFDLDEIERAGKTLADYGLEPARIELGIELPDGETLAVKVGAPTEIGDRVYVLGTDQRTVHVTSRSLLSSLVVDLESLRDARIFRIPDYEVRQLVMRVTTNGDLTVRLARQQTLWKFEAPIEVDADRGMVENTLQQLNTLEAIRFLDAGEVAGSATIVDPLLRITLEGSRGRETLILGEPPNGKTGVYLGQRADRDSLFLVPSEPFDTLLTAQRALRDRDFLQVDLEAVTGVTLEREGNVSLRRLENGLWQVLDSAGGEGIIPYDADLPTVARLMGSLSGVRAIEFVSDVPTESDLDRFGLVPPVWEILIEQGDAAPITFLVGKEGLLLDGTPIVYGKRADEPFVYALPRRVTAPWILDPLYYRNRVIQSLSPQIQISALRVERLIEGEAEVLLSEQIDPLTETWPIHIENWPTDVQGPFFDLIEMLGRVEVSRFLDDSFEMDGVSVEDGVEPWSLKLTYTLALPTDQDAFRLEDRSLFFTRRLSGSFQAGGSPWLDAVFQVSPDMIDALHQLFFERKPSELYRPPAVEGVPVTSEETSQPEELGAPDADNSALE